MAQMAGGGARRDAANGPESGRGPSRVIVTALSVCAYLTTIISTIQLLKHTLLERTHLRRRLAERARSRPRALRTAALWHGSIGRELQLPAGELRPLLCQAVAKPPRRAPAQHRLDMLGDRLAHGRVRRAGDVDERAVVAVEQPRVAGDVEGAPARNKGGVLARDRLRKPERAESRGGRGGGREACG